MSCPSCKECGKVFYLKKGLHMHELRCGHNGKPKMHKGNALPSNLDAPGFTAKLNDVGGLLHTIWAALNEADRQLMIIRNALGMKEAK